MPLKLANGPSAAVPLDAKLLLQTLVVYTFPQVIRSDVESALHGTPFVPTCKDDTLALDGNKVCG
jgi:hypothetical protein